MLTELSIRPTWVTMVAVNPQKLLPEIAFNPCPANHPIKHGLTLNHEKCRVENGNGRKNRRQLREEDGKVCSFWNICHFKTCPLTTCIRNPSFLLRITFVQLSLWPGFKIQTRLRIVYFGAIKTKNTTQNSQHTKQVR